MEQEYSRSQERDTHETDSAASFREFVAGVQAMTVHFDTMLANFAWCAAQIAGDTRIPEQIRSMMEFAARYHEAGLDTALAAIEENSGIYIPLQISQSRQLPCILIGLTGAALDGKQKYFSGIAMVENSRSQEAFVNVRVKPNGETFLNPNDPQREDPETVLLIKDLGLDIK